MAARCTNIWQRPLPKNGIITVTAPWWLLVPGVGAQGGDAKAVVQNAKTRDGTGLIVSASRSILYASNGDDYAKAAATAARQLRDTLNAAR